MAFKDIHKLKKIVEIQKEYIETEHLVVGKDVFAISTFRQLVEKYGTEKVKLLSEDKVGIADLYVKGPSTLRQAENLATVKFLYPETTFETIDTASIFYKDMVWKSFGGRSKPEALKFYEDFYVSNHLNANEKDFFPWLETSEEFFNQLNENAYQVKIKNIHYTEGKFLVECINGTEFKSSKLYFGKSPAYFLKNFAEKNILSDELIQFCESTRTVSGLFIKYLFEKPISNIKETMFIPLSYTHEWGHFIGEFKLLNGGQIADFLHFIDEDHTSEEDVSRTIRQLKKSFEKIFDNFSKINYQEYISIEDEIGCLKIDDDLYNRCRNGKDAFLNQVNFIGISAPINNDHCDTSLFEYSTLALTHVARALLIERSLAKNI